MKPTLIDETLRTINQMQQRELARANRKILELEWELDNLKSEYYYMRNLLARAKSYVQKSVDRATYPHQKKSS